MKTYRAAAIAAVASFGAPALAQRDFSAVEIKTTEIEPGLYMLEGAGGNIGLSTGPDGAFVIDDQFAPLADKILAAIGMVSAEPVKFLLNTHWHFDHTGGNEAFGGAGAIIVAHDRVRQRLIEGMKTDSFEVAPAPEAALPVVTFSEEVSFYWNGRNIRVVHPAPAHTDGDAIVFFDGAKVVHMGDTYFNGGYPFIDINSGGDLDGYIAAQETVLAAIDDQTKIMPGHGPMATKADLAVYNAMLKDVRGRIKKLVDKGLDEEAIVRADPLKDLNKKYGSGFINGEAMTRSAFKSLNRS